MSELKRMIENKAEELATKHDCHYNIAKKAIHNAIIDALLTDDSKLNEYIEDDYLDYELFLEERRNKREKEVV